MARTAKLRTPWTVGSTPPVLPLQRGGNRRPFFLSSPVFHYTMMFRSFISMIARCSHRPFSRTEEKADSRSGYLKVNPNCCATRGITA